MKTVVIVLLIGHLTFAAAANEILDALKDDNKNEADVIRLIEAGTDANVQDEDQDRPMHLAASKGYDKVVKLLIDKGYSSQIHSTNKWGNTPLHRATFTAMKIMEFNKFVGRENIARLLIENGANVNAANNNKWTQLHSAAENGHDNVVKLLIEKGADVNAKRDDGWTPLHMAAYHGHYNVLKLLVENGANINAVENTYFTPLNIATWRDKENEAKLLVEKGANLDSPDNNKWTPLHHSAQNGADKTVELLINAGADINAKTNAGQTPKDVAAQENKQNTVDILVAAARKPNRARINKHINRICESYRAGIPNDHIFGGRPSLPGEFPWMAALGYFNPLSNAIDYRCGGTMISEQYILTAAHCTDTEQPPVVVRVGSIYLNDPYDAQSYYIQRIIKHDDYSNQAKKHDIALLLLRRAIPITVDIRPACLDTDTHDKDSKVRLKVTGWGITSSGTYTVSDRLLIGEVNTIPLSECNATFVNHNKRINHPAFRDGITEGQYCAHDPVRKTNACQGDSGAPLQEFDDPNTARVVGIVSFGLGCGSRFPGIYTRVAHYTEWIASHVWPNVV